MKTLIILLTMFLSGASATFAVDAPQFQDGDRWEFNARRKAGVTSTSDTLSGNYEILYTQGRLDVFQIVEGQKTETSAGNAEDLKRLIPFKQDDLQFMNFPISDGKKWTSEYNHTQAGARRVQRRWATFQVEKMAPMKTSAGDFQAFRIKGTGQTHGGNVSREWDYYYSPDAKSIVKYFYDSGVGTQSGKIEIELVKFTPGRK